MTDETKDLLTLAAKAMGKPGVYQEWSDGHHHTSYGIAPDGATGREWWNPIRKAADNEEMECQLDIDTQFLDGGCRASHDPERGTYTTHYASYQHHNNNRIAARRWASLRVAAEIGRRIK